MGTAFLYKCSSCNYQAQSSGKLDAGMMGIVEPYICNDYKELIDILVYSLNGLDNQEPHTLCCRNCNSINITKWKTPKRPCPKCGGKMNKSNEYTILWD